MSTGSPVGYDGVEMVGIHRDFAGVTALAGVDFAVRHGEVHALLGENGAGKSTLMRILAGLLAPSSGTISVNGTEHRIESPNRAAALGIGMVHQHFMLVPTLTVTQNVALTRRGVLRTRRALRTIAAQITETAERTGLHVPLDVPVSQLSVGEQQRAEIIKALLSGSRFLILDEPTANLAPSEVAPLLRQLRVVAERDDVGIVIITHHLDEAIDVADRVTVLRQGKHIDTLDTHATTSSELARLMVGRDVTLTGIAARPHRPAGAVLELGAVATAPAAGRRALHALDLTVHSGEIVAVAGVEGNGQHELAELICGMRTPESGSVRIDGHDVTHDDTRRRLAAGLGVVPADRYREGLVRDLSIAHNLVLDRIDRAPFRRRFGVSWAAVDEHGRSGIERMSIKAASPDVAAATLSGGHAQRVVLGRALRDDLRLLVASQPTRGLDVGATEFVWDQLDLYRSNGVGIVLISSDLDEITALADRVLVLYRGAFVRRFDEPVVDREEIGRAMGGLDIGTADRDVADLDDGDDRRDIAVGATTGLDDARERRR